MKYSIIAKAALEASNVYLYYCVHAIVTVKCSFQVASTNVCCLLY